MSTYYSDHYTQTAATPGSAITTLPNPIGAIPINFGGARVRYKRASASTLALTTDTIRMMTFKSSDRLIELFIGSDGGSAAGAVDIGVYISGDNHDGAEVDDNIFSLAIDISSEIDRTDAWAESTTLAGDDRGAPLWQVASVSTATYTADPLINLDIVITPTTSFTTTVSNLVLEAYYVAGD